MIHKAMLVNPSIGFLSNHGPAGAGDGSSHACAVHESAIGSVDDSLRIVVGDIALRQLNGHPTGKHTFEQYLVHVRIVTPIKQKGGTYARPCCQTSAARRVFLLRLRNHGGKCRRILDRDIGQHLPVQPDFRLFHGGDQAAIGCAV
jgi:hypothetical protein